MTLRYFAGIPVRCDSPVGDEAWCVFPRGTGMWIRTEFLSLEPFPWRNG